MKKILISFVLFVFTWFLWITNVYAKFITQDENSIKISWSDDYNYHSRWWLNSQKWIAIWTDDYNENEKFLDFAQKATNWMLSLAGLYVIVKWLYTMDIKSTIKWLIFVWLTTFIANLIFNFYGTSRY